jgi:DNA-binding phage protein
MTLEQSLKAAATNDLKRICRAVDAAACSYGLTRIARDSKIDRATLFRAFRRESGLSLATMVRVLDSLGFRLIVEMKDQPSKLVENRSESHSARKWLPCILILLAGGMI